MGTACIMLYLLDYLQSPSKGVKKNVISKRSAKIGVQRKMNLNAEWILTETLHDLYNMLNRSVSEI